MHIALAVCDVVPYAGMPAVYVGLPGAGASGAVVSHDPYSDDSAGVYVHWLRGGK